MSEKVKVRIAVVVDGLGSWNAVGWGGPNSKRNDDEMMSLAVDAVEHGEARYWIEAEVEAPTRPVIPGAVTPDKE